MDNRLNGLNPLSYIGVNPYTPAPFVIHPRAPTTNDWQNFELGTFWLNNNQSSATYKSVWVLVSLTGNQADWALLSSGGGDLTSLLDDVNATILPDANGQIKVAGGATSAYTNITTLGNVNPNEIQVRLKDSIQLPVTNVSGSEGLYSLGANRFMHNYGTRNTFLGESSGRLNAAFTGTDNVGLGRSVMSTAIAGMNLCVAVGANAMQNVVAPQTSVAIGAAAMDGVGNVNRCVAIGNSPLRLAQSDDNIAIGSGSLGALTTGSGQNIGIGSGALDTLVTGAFCVGIGSDVGSNYVAAESSNILLNSDGVVGDGNTLRIGNGAGAGNKQLNKAFIHGIRGITTGVNDAVAVLVDSAGQLGTVSSSIRYKENINDLGSLSDNIYKMRPVVFNYKNHAPQDKSIGLIAEEVNLVMPSLVVRNAEGEIETIRYQDLPILLLNEIKKLKNRIDELERRQYDIGN